MKQNSRPIIISILFSLFVGLLVSIIVNVLPHELTDMRLCDTWFGSDIPRRYDALTNRFSYNGDAFKHPFFQLLFIPARVAMAILRCEPWNALSVLLFLNAILWSNLVWYILYRITRRILDTTIYGLLLASTAATLLWLPVVETYAFGSTSILIAIAVLVTPTLRFNALAQAIALVFSAAITITNAMFGIIAVVLSWKSLKTALFIAFAIAFFALGAIGSKRLFPNAKSYLAPQKVYSSINEDLSFFARIKPINKYVSDFIVQPLMPRFVFAGEIPKHYSHVRGDWWWPANRLPVIDKHRSIANVSYQLIHASNPALWTVATTLWFAILIAGMASAFALKDDLFLRIAIPAGILGQFALHFVYGHETAIYELHWMPSLIFLAALSSRTKMRGPCLFVSIIVALLCFYNNAVMLRQLIRYIGGINIYAL